MKKTRSCLFGKMIIMIINRLFLLYDPDHVAIEGRFFTEGHVTLDRGMSMARV